MASTAVSSLSVSVQVEHILGLRPPIQVSGTVVVSVSIFMQREKADRSWAVKRFTDKMVDLTPDAAIHAATLQRA